MNYDEKLRDRAELWIDTMKLVYSYRNFLSDKPPLFGDEIKSHSQRKNNECTL